MSEKPYDLQIFYEKLSKQLELDLATSDIVSLYNNEYAEFEEIRALREIVIDIQTSRLEFFAST